MAEPARFVIPKRPKHEIPFELESPDGDVELYTFTAPKRASLALEVAGGGIRQLTGLLSWLEAGLPEDQGARLEARLRDPEDGLDVETLAEVTKHLIEQSTARPTEPPSA